ncbi:uncharacterized protein E0L32_003624 [Thyridium curvatum]|uniref:DUF8004 domain-containing protein n=1 Tax=Thyridium curvatum TaxID=1093900 RepID=A0A507BAW9_9PEZI|nr:uncharacterized protein E0L32_003624 [Thyridium curvatum]TPX16683.1 hypothetical protein E0L32_003624 [Thyridium curvatum]
MSSSRGQDSTMPAHEAKAEAAHHHGSIPSIVANAAPDDAAGETGSISSSTTVLSKDTAAPEPVPGAARKRRKSTLQVLASLIPMLNTSERADIPPPVPLAASRSISRKPVGSSANASPSDHAHPASFSHNASLLPNIDQAPIGLGLAAPDLPPPPPPRPVNSQAPPAKQNFQPGLTLDTSSAVAEPDNMLRATAGTHDVPVLPPPYGPPPVPAKHDATPSGNSVPQQTQESPSVLHKTRQRAQSGTFHGDHKRKESDHHARLQPRRRTSNSPEPRGRSSSARPASNRNSLLGVGHAPEPREASKNSSDGGHSPAPDRGKIRRSFLPGSRSRSNSHDFGQSANGTAAAWVMSPESNAEYNLNLLTNGEKVPELWNESGTVYVYLYPKESGRGASFKVPSWIVGHSRVFNELIQAEMSSPVSARSRARSFGGRDSLSVADATRVASPPVPGEGETRLFIPNMSASNGQLAASNQPPMQDLERVVAIRNLFAFLTGQPLVGTTMHGNKFSAFFQIASLLREFDFSSADGSSFGEAVDLSFGFYVDQLGLADVRHSREKTIEALVLGEQMKSWTLYNEAFAHAVGKYTAILDIKSPLFHRVSLNTRQRLERAHIDLLNRQHNVNIRLESFDFPGIFAGTASSTSTAEYRNIRFNKWRTAFGDMRSFILKYYKTSFGNWPPKASSKKNPFSESGLNRQVLKALYSDLCSLYDLLVDRESLTPRVIDQEPEDLQDTTDTTILALRKILGEFDHSSPPVLPPIPFDTPKIPTMTTIRETYPDMPPKEQQRFDRSIQPHELQLILIKSYNLDADAVKTPFLDSFKEFEQKAARGSSEQELSEQRIGYWLFLYVVLQSLPMLVVDAPGLQYTEGVEYFLCEPPQGNLPWLEDAGEVRKMWYEVAGGASIVELSADVVMFSVEATYHRSHCWLAAKSWEEYAADQQQQQQQRTSPSGGPLPGAPPGLPPPELSPLEPPHATFQDMDPASMSSSSSMSGPPPTPPVAGPSPPPGLQPQMALRGRSPARTSAYRPSSIAIGLEPVDFPPQQPLDRSSRVFSAPVAPGGGGGLPRPSSTGNLQYVAAGSASSHPRGDSVAGPLGGGSSRLAPSATVGAGVGGETGGGGGSTFDDILQGMDGGKEKKKKGIFGF